jgi:hypothetical protein
MSPIVDMTKRVNDRNASPKGTGGDTTHQHYLRNFSILSVISNGGGNVVYRRQISKIGIGATTKIVKATYKCDVSYRRHDETR